MKKNDFSNMLRNNVFVFKFMCRYAPRRVVFDFWRRTYLPIYLFFEHIYVYKFVLDSIQYSRPFIHVVYYMLAIFIGQLILNRGEDIYDTYFREKDEQKIIKALQFKVYGCAAKIDLIRYDDKEFFDDYVWSINDAKVRFTATYDTIMSIYDSLVNIIVAGTFVFISDMFGIVIVLATFTAQFFLNKRSNKIEYQRDMDLRPSRRVIDYVKRIFYMQDYAAELRMNNINSKFYNKHKEAVSESVNIIKKSSKPLMVINFIMDFILNTLVFDVIYILYLAYKALVLKLMSYGTIISVIRSLTWYLQGSISRLVSSIPKLYQNSLYIDKYNEFLAFKSGIKSGDDTLEGEKIEKLELKNISFSYDGHTPVLKNVSMTINKNEKIAVVGYNGAGKTTLSNILLRLYEKDEGELLVNGKPAETIDLESYKSRFSAVFQDFYLYAASVRENITLDITNPHGGESDERRLDEAVRLSGFSGKLSGFEKGADTQLTKEFDEAGVNLSGGESQKIALARAVYRQSDIIIMDEPSSALDPIAEAHLNETIMEIAENRIVFFISHRLSTTKLADKIFYIENGEIIESGSHSDLMSLNGKYAEMFSIQAMKYNKK